MVDRSLHEMMIPASMLRELRDVGDFSSVDFQLDGVLAVTDQGRHAEQPQPLAPKHEWLQFGTPAVGLKWRQVPLENFLYSGKLKAETVHQQMRMTKLAREAFGREHANAAPDFLISQDELAGQNKDRHSFKGEEAKARGHAAKLQSCVRRMLLRQLYPWIHVSRLATYSDKSTTKRKKGSGRNKEFTEYGTGAGPSIPPPPELPWCSAWSSLEPSFELDPKTTLAMRKIVSDFESDNFESSLRRVDNLVLARGRGKLARPDRVLVELAALCNRFGLRLFFLSRVEHAHAFFSRVLSFSHLTSATLFLGKPELFAWTCSLVAYCLWTQEKPDQAHFTLARCALGNVPRNVNVVTRLQAAQILLKLNKPEMVVAMVSQVMHELVAARYEHQVARQANSKLADTDQILKIVHLPEEREKQKQTPTYANLLAHAAQTLAHALVKLGRIPDALTVARTLEREWGGAAGAAGDALGVSHDIQNCTRAFTPWAEERSEAVSLDSLISEDPARPGAYHDGVRAFNDGRVSTDSLPAIREARAPQRGGGGRPMRGARQTHSLSPPRGVVGAEMSNYSIGSAGNPQMVATGSVILEPSTENTWANDFFSDGYWQRHDSRRIVVPDISRRDRRPFR